jgi:hypothetical protein
MTKTEQSGSRTPRTSQEAETLMATLSQRLREAFAERRALRGHAAEMKAAYHQALSIATIEGRSKPDRAPVEAVEKEIRDLEEHLLGLTLAIRDLDATRRDLKRAELAAERDGLKGALASLEEQMKAKEDELKALRERERGLCWSIRQLQDKIDAPAKSFREREVRSIEEVESLAFDLSFQNGHEVLRLLEECEEALAQGRGCRLQIMEKRTNGHLRAEAVPVQMSTAPVSISSEQVPTGELSPEEIEAKLAHHPAVSQVCVLAARDGQGPRALVVLRSEWSPSEELSTKLNEFVRSSSPRYKAPASIEFLARNETPKDAPKLLRFRQAANPVERAKLWGGADK